MVVTGIHTVSDGYGDGFLHIGVSGLEVITMKIMIPVAALVVMVVMVRITAATEVIL